MDEQMSGAHGTPAARLLKGRSGSRLYGCVSGWRMLGAGNTTIRPACPLRECVCASFFFHYVMVMVIVAALCCVLDSGNCVTTDLDYYFNSEQMDRAWSELMKKTRIISKWRTQRNWLTYKYHMSDRMHHYSPAIVSTWITTSLFRGGGEPVEREARKESVEGQQSHHASSKTYSIAQSSLFQITTLTIKCTVPMVGTARIVLFSI